MLPGGSDKVFASSRVAVVRAAAKNLLWALGVIVTALIQTSWLDSLQIFGAIPDLNVLIVVYFALREGEERGMFTGLFGGILEDVASNATLGHHVLGLVLVAYAVGRVRLRLLTDHPAVRVCLVFAASLLEGILFMAILFVQQPEIPALNLLAARIVPGAFYTAILTPVWFLGFDWVLRRFQSSSGGLA